MHDTLNEIDDLLEKTDTPVDREILLSNRGRVEAAIEKWTEALD